MEKQSNWEVQDDSTYFVPPTWEVQDDFLYSTLLRSENSSHSIIYNVWESRSPSAGSLVRLLLIPIHNTSTSIQIKSWSHNYTTRIGHTNNSPHLIDLEETTWWWRRIDWFMILQTIHHLQEHLSGYLSKMIKVGHGRSIIQVAHSVKEVAWVT